MTSTTSGTRTTSITLSDEQIAALAPIFALVGVDLGAGSVPADQTPEVSLEESTIGANAAGKAIYLDGPRKGKFAPTLTDAERAEKAKAGEAYVAERAGKVEARRSSNADMAAFIRGLGFVPNGTVWEAVKAGERSKTVLAKAHKVDEAARAAAKAAKA